MKISVEKLSNTQLTALLAEFNHRMASAWRTKNYEKEKQKYFTLLQELKHRRENNLVEIPLVVKKNLNNRFGEINREYLETLVDEDYQNYINWKWVEL